MMQTLVTTFKLQSIKDGEFERVSKLSQADRAEFGLRLTPALRAAIRPAWTEYQAAVKDLASAEPGESTEALTKAKDESYGNLARALAEAAPSFAAQIQSYRAAAEAKALKFEGGSNIKVAPEWVNVTLFRHPRKSTADLMAESLA